MNGKQEINKDVEKFKNKKRSEMRSKALKKKKTLGDLSEKEREYLMDAGIYHHV